MHQRIGIESCTKIRQKIVNLFHWEKLSETIIAILHPAYEAITWRASGLLNTEIGSEVIALICFECAKV